MKHQLHFLLSSNCGGIVLKKSIALLLSCLLLFSIVPQMALANSTPLGSLELVEELLYGAIQEGSLLDRIDRVELDIYDEVKEGAVLLRIDRVLSFLHDAQGEGGLHLLLNLAEWGFSANLTAQDPLLDRLEGLEILLYGEGQVGNIAQRSERLMLDVWGTTKLDVKRVTLPEKSLVKIALLKTIDSGSSQVGDEVLYKVVEDVMIDGRVVIPVGSTGKGRVAEVVSAGRLGKDGRILVDFGRISSLDGSQIRLKVDETATERNKSPELAAGASMAGIMLLGPVGLVGGYFVKGKNVQIEANTQFYVETTQATPVSGFYFRPAISL